MAENGRKKTDLERAQEHERKAKELRAKVRKKTYEKRLKIFGKIIDILEGVLERELDEKDIEDFKAYATGIGKVHIVKALNVNKPLS